MSLPASGRSAGGSLPMVLVTAVKLPFRADKGGLELLKLGHRIERGEARLGFGDNGLEIGFSMGTGETVGKGDG